MSIDRFVRAGALIAAATYAAGAAALTFEEVPPLETIAARASLAFRGVVLGIGHADATLDEGHSYPYTITRLRALACYRGCEPGQEIEIARLGGPRNGDMRHYLVIPGIASFAAGEEVVILANDQVHAFFGSSFGDRGVLRVAHADGGERVVLSYAGEFLREDGGRLRADGTRRCEAIAGRPQDCASVVRAARDDGDDDDSARPAGRAAPDAVLTPAALDARLHEIARAHPIEQAPQVVSGDAGAFERALAEAFRRARAR
jgi:hypothetical protein